MRFIDANVFIYAIVDTKRKLDADALAIKTNAKRILERINSEEKGLTSVVHLSEVANVLERFFSISELSELISKILRHENIEIADVTSEEYILACDYAREYEIGVNDALAAIIMKESGIEGIYSFNSHFITS